MRWMLPLGLLGFVVWAALPAEAGDRDKERIARLEAENTALRTAFENLNKSTDRSIQALAKLGKDFAAMRADYERLQDEAAALRRASARMRVEHEKTILKLQEALAKEQRAHADDQHKGRGESSATARAHRLAIN